MKALTSFLSVSAIATVLVFSFAATGCGKKKKAEETPKARTLEGKQPDKKVKLRPAKNPFPLPTIKEENPKLDIAACDKYLARFEKCEVLPKSVRNSIRVAFVTWRGAIAKAASNKDAREQVEFSCKASARTWEKTLKENKCN